MNPNARIVNADDRRRLQDAIRAARSSWSTYGPYLDWLSMQLEEATVVEAAEVPPDVVTMESQVDLYDLRTGRRDSVSLVYPRDSDRTRNTVSIFEPAGIAMLGRRVGHVVGWNENGLSRTAIVDRLNYQPEASLL